MKQCLVDKITIVMGVVHF